jgi:hypothetical protein
MKNIVVATAVALAACRAVPLALSVATATENLATAQEQSAQAAGTAPANEGLSDLNAMTFGCPKAALNAAAREAAKVRSQGTYQFAYFRIISDTHHASYEVHFKSNYPDEADLKYCVSMYCQQGWDPNTTKTSVSLMTSARQPKGSAAHGAECGARPAPVKRPPKR